MTPKMQYGMSSTVTGGFLTGLTELYSSPRQLWPEGFQDHPWLHVLRLARMAAVGSRRGGGHQAHQVRVGLPSRSISTNTGLTLSGPAMSMVSLLSTPQT